MNLNDEGFIEMAEVCGDLSTIAECNYEYSRFLYQHIEKTGKSINELTVKELLALHYECGRLYNDIKQQNLKEKYQ